MKFKVFAALAALGLAASALVAGPDTALGKDEPKKEAKPGPAGTIAKSIGLAPRGMKFGLSNEQIAKLYDTVLDEEFLPLLKKTEPGLKMTALEEELKDKKGVLRRSRIEFGNTPTGVDQSALKGEYSYRNGESMSRITLRSGTVRHLFFFSDKLWKIYDEHKLAQGGTLGKDFQEAVKILGKRFGSPPKMVPADFSKGQSFDEAVWRDPDKVIRALDRGNILGMVYADKNIADNLAQYRKNKPVDEHAMDKDVAAVTSQPPEDPSKQKAPKDDKKGKKK
jgi:hypothetical protein